MAETVPDLEERVAETIRRLYALTGELEELLPGRHYTLDGHLVGSIGEALAARWYGLTLYPAGRKTHDAVSEGGREVQIKVTQRSKVALSGEPEYLLVMELHPDGYFTEVYNGPGAPVWQSMHISPTRRQQPVTLSRLRELQKTVPHEQRLQRKR